LTRSKANPQSDNAESKGKDYASVKVNTLNRLLTVIGWNQRRGDTTSTVFIVLDRRGATVKQLNVEDRRPFRGRVGRADDEIRRLEQQTLLQTIR